MHVTFQRCGFFYFILFSFFFIVPFVLLVRGIGCHISWLVGYGTA